DSSGRPPTNVPVYAGGDQVAETQQSGTNIMYSDRQPGEFRLVPGYQADMGKPPHRVQGAGVLPWLRRHGDADGRGAGLVDQHRVRGDDRRSVLLEILDHRVDVEVLDLLRSGPGDADLANAFDGTISARAQRVADGGLERGELGAGGLGLGEEVLVLRGVLRVNLLLLRGENVGLGLRGDSLAHEL